jgi:hypothetical protein
MFSTCGQKERLFPYHNKEQLLGSSRRRILSSNTVGENKQYLAPRSLTVSRRLEHRKHPRVTIEWPAVLMTRDGQREGTIRNISLGGALIACVEMPALDDRFILVAESDGGVVLKLTAEKVWSANFNLNGKTTFSGIGVRFTEVSEDNRQIIKKAVSHRLSPDQLIPKKAINPGFDLP